MNKLWIEDMVLPVLSKGFKSTMPKNYWSLSGSTYKLKVEVTNDQYTVLRQLFKSSVSVFDKNTKAGDVGYSIKTDKGYFCGFFDILSMQELSKTKNKRTMQLEISNLECDKVDTQTARNLSLSDLLD
jgi:hypothetical protein